MQMPEPQKEHQWLKQLVGTWTSESECIMGPDQPPIKSKGTDRVRMLGDLWAVCEMEGEMPDGGAAQMIMTLGFDPAKGKFVGTFIGGMMTFLWVYEGELDAAGKVLTLNVEGPSFAGDGKMAKYQDIIEIKSASERTLSSQVLGEDGKWTRFMTATYKKV